MDQPNNIFAFESHMKLHVFVAIGEFDSLEFSEFVDKASLECVPDEVCIYYPESLTESSDLKIVTNKVEARFHCKPSYCSFDSKGSFGRNEKKVKAFLKNGTREIIRLREPVIVPPPGRSFMKPSGAVESYFIQAANLFVRHAEMSFFALLLIRKWGDVFDEKIKTIYVDTIDLYGLVSVACKMRFNSDVHGPITVSYSSYTGYKEVLKDAEVSSSLMVISATTTHRLLRKILKNTRWKSAERVITVLDLDPSLYDGSEQVETPKVISHVTPPSHKAHSKLLPSIRLSGEKFTIEADGPKSVVLNAVSHSICLQHLKLPELKEMVDCLAGYTKSGSDRLPIYVNSLALLKNTKFRSWLKAEIENYAPASTSHVVCMGNIAEEVKPLLEVFGENQPQVISPDNIRDKEIAISGSTLVVCPTFTTGTKLLEVSRDLRKHVDHKNIIYFTGIGTPVSLHEFKKLKRNLEHQKYQLRSFCNVCTGQPDSLALSWQTEQELLRDEDGLGAADELKARAKILENGNLEDQTLFYGVSDLDLHDGFKYWENLVQQYPSKHPSVLLFATFAFLLQNARTDSSLPEKDRLAPLSNRRVLLDPENFFRYNDSLIQIAILRAAFPGELDYSDHEQHSASIYYLIQRAVQTRQRSVIYEFLLALASQRLLVSRAELGKIRKLVGASKLKECKWFKKLDFFTVSSKP